MPVRVVYHVTAEVIENLTGSDYLNETFIIGRVDIELKKSHTDQADLSFERHVVLICKYCKMANNSDKEYDYIILQGEDICMETY